ncbi:hypothetical protein FKM82_027860 [Ascaphus truei]
MIHVYTVQYMYCKVAPISLVSFTHTSWSILLQSPSIIGFARQTAPVKAFFCIFYFIFTFGLAMAVTLISHRNYSYLISTP